MQLKLMCLSAKSGQTNLSMVCFVYREGYGASNQRECYDFPVFVCKLARAGNYETMAIVFSNAGNCRTRTRYNRLFSGDNAPTCKDFYCSAFNANNDSNTSTGSLSISNYQSPGTAWFSSELFS